MMNVDKMFDKNGKPRFKYIVEGANLFISEDARAVLEDAGIILFKDASTNKGGVTSSSLEVLAGLAMDDIEFS
jgi:glutamate dehydrogenase